MENLYKYALKGHFEELRSQFKEKSRDQKALQNCIGIIDELIGEVTGQQKKQLEIVKSELLLLVKPSEGLTSEGLKPMRKAGIKVKDQQKASN